MSNEEHIGRLLQIGFGDEVTPGVGVSPTRWIKKVTGILLPEVTTVDNESTIGTIGSRTNSEKTKSMTKFPFSGVAHTEDIGYFLKSVYGSATLTVPCTFSGVAGGTPAVGDSVSIVSPAMTGTIKYIAEGVYHIEVLTGAFTSASNTQTITDGVWTATVGGIDNLIFSHVFERLNNNCHPSKTIYAYDPVDPQRATYGMIDTFEMEMAAGELVSISGEFKAQQIEDDATGSTPSYDESEYNFIARQTQVKIGANISALDGATAEKLSRFKVSFSKNLLDFQAINGTVDIDAIFNQNWDVTGDFDALFNSLVLRDYDLDNSQLALRVLLNATDFTIGSAGNPSLLFDFSEVGFRDWTSTDDNNALREQTLGFAQNEKTDSATSMIVVAVLTNTHSTAY